MNLIAYSKENDVTFAETMKTSITESFFFREGVPDIFFWLLTRRRTPLRSPEGHKLLPQFDVHDGSPPRSQAQFDTTALSRAYCYLRAGMIIVPAWTVTLVLLPRPARPAPAHGEQRNARAPREQQAPDQAVYSQAKQAP